MELLLAVGFFANLSSFQKKNTISGGEKEISTE